MKHENTFACTELEPERAVEQICVAHVLHTFAMFVMFHYLYIMFVMPNTIRSNEFTQSLPLTNYRYNDTKTRILLGPVSIIHYLFLFYKHFVISTSEKALNGASKTPHGISCLRIVCWQASISNTGVRQGRVLEQELACIIILMRPSTIGTTKHLSHFYSRMHWKGDPDIQNNYQGWNFVIPELSHHRIHRMCVCV